MKKDKFRLTIPVINNIIINKLFSFFFSIVLGILVSYIIAFINAERYNHAIRVNNNIYAAAIICCFVFLESISFISGKIDKRIGRHLNNWKRYWIHIFIVVPYSILFWVFGSFLISIFFAGDQFFDGIEILIFFFIGLTISVLYCTARFTYYYLKRKHLSEVNKLKFEMEDIQVKFYSLKDQLSPHFLFNNLNTLYGLINENTALASEYLIMLSNIYRYVIESKENEVTTLKSEIDFIDKYLHLLKIRYGSNLTTITSVKLDSEKFYLPPLTLQILIENAQKHNNIDDENPVKIEIYNDGNEFLVVKNNINKQNKETLSLKFGLSNLKSRYSYLTNKNIEIISTSSSFTVRVPLIQM